MQRERYTGDKTEERDIGKETGEKGGKPTRNIEGETEGDK
jgi:hypothetical protein